MNLPCLPGFNFERNIGKNSFHKSQKFFYANNNIQTNIYNDKGRQAAFHGLPTPHQGGPTHPPWVAFDKQVLCFDGMIDEKEIEGRKENERMRKCKIFYFLEDGTMKVSEPKVQNSGLEQGVLVRRHQINKPPPDDDDIYTVEDLNIGNILLIYGISYTLFDCDEFTKRFLRKLGVELGEPIQQTKLNQQKLTQQQTQQQEHAKCKESKFWKYDGQVLKFLCLWEDVDNKERRKMLLKYYLSDDTIDINEVHSPNSGRDGITFLNRCKLPKGDKYLNQPGTSSTKLLLNVFHNRHKLNTCMIDGAQVNEIPNCYHDDELMLGTFVNVFGRKFLICDCDDFTKEYYRNKYGITNFSPITIETETQKLPEPLAPPYNGFGSYEDSLNSAVRLLPQPPKKDLIKFLTNDRQGFDGKVLRFSAQLVGGDDNDGDRRFILSYYLVDDTIQIYEVIEKNSGMIGGRFLERCKVTLPGQDKHTCITPAYYKADDLLIGKILNINRRSFLLVAADEYTMNYMEEHTRDFPQSDMKLISGKLSSILTRYSIDSCNWNRSLSEKEFHQLLGDLTNHELSRQEIHSIYRFLIKRNVPSETIGDHVYEEVQGQLKKHGFQDLHDVRDACYHFDANKSHRLPTARIRLIFKSMKVPIDSKLLEQFLKIISVDGTIDYVNMIKFMNWKVNDRNTCPQDDDDDDDDVSRKMEASILRNFLISLLKDGN